MTRCPRCLFQACLCADVPVVAARTQVVIVRHPAERHRSSNSGRLAHLALVGSVLTEPVAPLPPLDGAALLFPIGEPAQGPPAPPPRRLVVLDASWSQARRMYRKLEALRGLPVLHVAATLAPARMRASPAPGRVSTIEAIAQALRLLEGDAVAAPLEALFALAVERSRASGRQGAVLGAALR